MYCQLVNMSISELMNSFEVRCIAHVRMIERTKLMGGDNHACIVYM